MKKIETDAGFAADSFFCGRCERRHLSGSRIHRKHVALAEVPFTTPLKCFKCGGDIVSEYWLVKCGQGTNDRESVQMHDYCRIGSGAHEKFLKTKTGRNMTKWLNAPVGV